MRRSEHQHLPNTFQPPLPETHRLTSVIPKRTPRLLTVQATRAKQTVEARDDSSLQIPENSRDEATFVQEIVSGFRSGGSPGRLGQLDDEALTMIRAGFEVIAMDRDY